MVSPLAFIGAERYHSGGRVGLRGGEVPAILQRGETVLPAGANMGGFNTEINVTVNASGGTQSQNMDLAKQVGRAIDRALDSKMTTWTINQKRPGGLLS